MICPVCGSIVSDALKFCETCGAAMTPASNIPEQPKQTRTSTHDTPPLQATPSVQNAPSPRATQAQATQAPTAPQNAQPPKKRGIAPAVGIIVAVIVAASLLWMVASRSGQPSSTTSTSTSSSSSAQKAQEKADAIEFFTGTWELVGITSGNWEPSAAEIQDLKDRGFGVSINLAEDGEGELVVFGNPSEATWNAANTSRVSLVLNGEQIEGGVSTKKQLKLYSSSYGTLIFEKGAVGKTPSEDSGDQLEAVSGHAIDSIFDLANPDTYLTEQPTPANGEILYDDAQWKASEITITAPYSSPCYVKLKDMTGNDVMSWWIEANQTATVQVPGITGQIVYATGKTWYGTEDLFGSSTSYSKPDETFDFSTYTYELIFQLMRDGNMRTEDIDADEF